MNNTRFIEILGLEISSYPLVSNKEIFDLFKECFDALEKICKNDDTKLNFLESIDAHENEDIRDIASWLREEGITLIKNILLTPIKEHTEVNLLVKRNKFILDSGVKDALNYHDYHSFYMAFLDTIYGIDDKVDYLKMLSQDNSEKINLGDSLDTNNFKDDFWVNLSENSHLYLPPAQKAGFFYEE